MSAGKKLNILIVDDEPHITTFIRLYFEPEYNVYEADSGIQALLLAKQIKPDIVVMDTTLPKYDGFQVCSRMKQIPELKHIPIILMVRYMESQDELMILRSEADDYVVKPFDIHVLERRINKLMNKVDELVVEESIAQLEGDKMNPYAEVGYRMNKHFHKQFIKQHGYLKYKAECIKLNCKPLIAEVQQ